MPHETLKLLAGVNTTETPALNEAGVSSCNLVRYVYDVGQGALIQKLGGWQKFYANQTPAIVRALVAWQDLDEVKHLAYGTQNIGTTGSAQLGVVTFGTLLDITPEIGTSNIAPVVSTTAGSNLVTITDTNIQNITSNDSVNIQTHIAVGGIILYGVYPTTYVSATQYSINTLDILGNPEPAISTSSSPVVASFSTLLNVTQVIVTLPNHGYSVGSTYTVLVSTTVGGLTLYGDYVVELVATVNVFVIFAATAATSAATASINGGNALYVYALTPSPAGSSEGYGGGGYGFGPYGGGVPLSASGTAISATDWVFDYWGEILLACPINGTLNQPICAWDPLSGFGYAMAIAQAPPISDGFFVAMPQRQIIAWGTTETGIQDPLLVRWCDVNNYNMWYDLVTNQAGDFRLPRGSKIVAGLQAPSQGLLWTDLDVWTMQYIGPPDVYSFVQVGSGCGLIARKAAAVQGGDVFWMGVSQFFTLTPSTTTGGGVSPLPCPVWDVAFQDLDTSNLTKIRAAVNSSFNEVTWYFPTLSSGGEVAAYVKYNTFLQKWDYGTLGRSAWIDQSVLGQPIGADPSTLYIYQHETSNDADGAAMTPFFKSGYATVGDGEQSTFIDQVWPDMKFGMYGATQGATLTITFNGANYPNGTVTTYGPYTYTVGTSYLTPRIRNRLVSVTISSADTGSFWRIGAMRYRYAPDGKF